MRFFKTRQLAAAAVRAGHVEVNGRKAKPATGVRAGDRLQILKDRFRYEIEVLELLERRVGAEIARKSYRESERSIAAREEMARILRDERSAVRYDDRRPSKRERRSMERIKRLAE